MKTDKKKVNWKKKVVIRPEVSCTLAEFVWMFNVLPNYAKPIQKE